MAQKTFVAGDVLTAADVNTYLTGEGGTWTTWTPTLSQLGTVTTTSNSQYGRWGRLIVANFSLSVTGAGTAANAVAVSLPVTARAGGAVGSGRMTIYDTSVGLWYTGTTGLASATTLQALSDGNGLAFNAYLGIVGFTAALAAGDSVSGQIIYEAAS